MSALSLLYDHTVSNHLPDVGSEEQGKLSRVIDLDIDIGADAVDYKYVALPVKN